MALLDIRNLNIEIKTPNGRIKIVDGINLSLNEGEIGGLVGESGSGKSLIAKVICNAVKENWIITADRFRFDDVELLKLNPNQRRKLVGKEISMIFQDPLSSLNPLHRIGKQIEEALIYHTELSAEERQKRVIELLTQVGIPNPERCAKQYPHELSGGMRQRVMIAMAMSCKPSVLIADEPTTALDVTIQAQILDLIKGLQAEMHAGIILITHDLGVVAEMADRVAVLYAGEVVEIGTAEQIFKNPQHPYTRSLLRSIPQIDDEEVGEELYVIQGMVPSLKTLDRQGCRFANRIPWLKDEHHEHNPTLHEVEEGHHVRCTCHRNFEFEGEENNA